MAWAGSSSGTPQLGQWHITSNSVEAELGVSSFASKAPQINIAVLATLDVDVDRFVEQEPQLSCSSCHIPHLHFHRLHRQIAEHAA